MSGGGGDGAGQGGGRGQGNGETATVTEPLEPGSPGAAQESVAAAPGATIGRFVVLGSLGKGGMGVVLAAYDPALDRKVALKLLRPDAWSRSGAGTGRLRLMREAQAMARLAHPNVVAVHEVGSVGEQLFIAMELVDGETLRAWLGDGERDWREIVRMFVAAGRGLEAAHAAGLVHRDFKPENVLIGRDGRPRVGDFGLVSAARPDPAEPEAKSEPQATQHGAIVGTPGFIAPEQLRGEPSGAAADQFSFCVALYTAVYGQRPFPSEPEEAHRQAVLSGRVWPPPRAPARPRWLGDAILRGLAAEPQARWPSMTALLAALERDQRRAAQRRRFLWGGGLVLAASVLAVGLGVAREQRGAACADAPARLDTVWDATRQAGVARAFAGGGRPDADAVFLRVRTELERYLGDWAAMHEESCRATRLEGRQSERLWRLRDACLDARLDGVRALVEAWSAPLSPAALEGAVAAVLALPPLDECADARGLGERLPGAAPAALATAVRGQIDRARALAAVRRDDEAAAQAQAARQAATASADPELQSEAALLDGELRARRADPEALPALAEAARQAARAHDDRLAARALVARVERLAADPGQATQAELTARAAAAFVTRAGDPPRLAAALALARARAAMALGHAAEAHAALDEARAAWTRALPRGFADRPEAATLQEALGDLAAAQGDGAAAESAYLRARTVVAALQGETGPAVARLDARRATVALDDGRRDDAAALLAVATAGGAGDPDVWAAQARLARSLGDLPGAHQAADRALSLHTAAYGAAAPLPPALAAELGLLDALAGRCEAARARLDAAQAALATRLPPGHPRLAELAAARRRCPTAARP